MARTASDRIKRAALAGIVLLAHVVLVWIFMLVRSPQIGNETIAEPVIATLIDQPRDLALGPVPIQVKTEDVLHLQRLAPKIPDIPVDEPEPTTITVPLPASAPIVQQANAGLGGEARESGGHSGGGRALTLLQRVIPRYPARSDSRGEQGATGVLIRVEESGRVKEVKVARSSGYPRLDEAAVEAIRKWKFARAPPGSAPNGTWAQTELRFIRYRFTYSRIGDGAADAVYEQEVKTGAMDEPTPGSQEALTRFMADVSAGAFTGELDVAARDEIGKVRAALAEWGEVESIQFTGTAGAHRWMAYPIRPGSGLRVIHPTVEVSWNMFEVRHQRGTSEWLIAIDRDGRVWSARASPAPWL